MDHIAENLGRTTIMGSQSYALHSKHIGQVFQIDVAKPTRGAKDGKPVPVVYLLDGNSSFGMAPPPLRLLQDDGLPLTVPVIEDTACGRTDDGPEAG